MTEPWVKVAALMPSNRKVREVSVPARWAYVSAICYSGANLTDGFIPASALPMVDATRKIAHELAGKGLWEPTPGGWLIHDFLRWNRSREKVTGLKETLSVNGSRGGAARWQNERQTDSNLPAESDGKNEANCSLSVSDPVSPLGDQPPRLLGDPDLSGTEKKPKPSKLPSKPRQSVEFTDGNREYAYSFARDESREDVDAQIQACRDYHEAEGNVVRDWNGRLRTWLTTWLRDLEIHRARLGRANGTRRPEAAPAEEDPYFTDTNYSLAIQRMVRQGHARSIPEARSKFPYEKWLAEAEE